MEVFRENIYQVEDNEDFSDISRKYRVSEIQLRNLNDKKKIEVGDYILLPQSYKHIYIVKPNDTLESICLKFNTTPNHIKKLNGVSEFIFIGQQLFI